MAIKLQIVASIFSLSAVVTQIVKIIDIDMEGLGTKSVSTAHSRPMAEVAGLINAKDYENAITYLKNSPIDFIHKHLWLRGFCYLQTGDVENATKDLLQGVDRDPANQNIVDFITTEALLSDKKYEQAAYKKMKTLPIADLRKLGDILCSKKKFDEALQCYSEAFILFHTRNWKSDSLYEYHVSRGNCYAKMEEFELSLADFKHAQRSKPEKSKNHDENDGDGESQVLLILALFEAGFFDKSLRRMNDLRSEKDVVSAIEGILNKNKNLEEALPFFSSAIKNYPENTILYEKRGHHYQKMKKYKEAINDFRKGTSKTSESSLADSWISLINILLLTGEHAEAKEVLKNFDKLAVPMKNSQLVELETARLKVLRTKQEMKKTNDETNEWK